MWCIEAKTTQQPKPLEEARSRSDDEAPPWLAVEAILDQPRERRA